MVLPPRNGLSLCSGGGGLDMGLELAAPGFAAACFVEWEEYPRSVLIAAQRAGYFAPAPIWDNVRTFDGRPWRGICDTVLAGYPCQPFSAAGQRKGEADPRHLWPDVARIIREVQPEWVFLENVPGHVTLGLETVLRTLCDMGFTPAVGLFSASEVGASHERLRMFIVGHSLANANGRNARAEREQRSGEQRFFTAGRGIGSEDVVHAEHTERWKNPARRHISDRDDARWDQASSGAGKSDPPLDNPTSARCDGAGFGPGSHIKGGECVSGDRRHAVADPRGGRRAESIEGENQQPGRTETVGPSHNMGDSARIGRGKGRAEPIVRRGRNTAARPSGAMANATGADGQRHGRGPAGCPGLADCGGQLADTGRPERQGEQRGEHHARGWQVKDGYSALPGRAGVFPPSPSDGAAWADTLAAAPYLAPATGLADCLVWAGRLAQTLDQQNKSAAQSDLRRMADGLASRSSQLRLLGNGVVPLAAAYAWRTLSAAHGLGAMDLDATTNHRTVTCSDGPVLTATEKESAHD